MSNKLSQYSGLKNEITVYVPSTQKNGDAVENRQAIITDTQRLLSTLFGGFTSTSATGGWTLESGTVQSEGIELVSSSSDSISDNQIDSVVDYALKLCDSCNQEAISVKVNGVLHFIVEDKIYNGWG